MPALGFPTGREEAIEQIALGSISGYLGLFVGTGFSKAATDGDAPNFEELLKKVATTLRLDPNFESEPEYRYKSFPQIASQLLSNYKASTPKANMAYDQFYETVAQHCNLVPDSTTGGELSSALKSIEPVWIITTNYDLLLEALLEDAESMLPNQPLIMRKHSVPIYHIHGHRYNPSTIRITEEDYVGLLGPIDYQRLKLPLLLVESTTLMLGYALGDINVRAAMECSRSFRGEDRLKIQPPQGVVFQALYNDSPNPDPYEGPNGEVIIEIDDISLFLEEVSTKKNEISSHISAISSSIQLFLADPNNTELVTEDPEKRLEFLTIIKTAMPLCKPGKFLEFLDNTLHPIWMTARQDGMFRYYKIYLELLLDIIERVDYTKINPSVLAYLADSLNKVGGFMDPGRSLGTSYSATNHWMERRGLINDNLKHELLSYADAYHKTSLTDMLSWE